MTNPKILKVLDDGGIICYAASSNELVLLDSNSIATEVQPSLEDFISLKEQKMISSKKYKMLRRGHHILKGSVRFYVKVP